MRGMQPPLPSLVPTAALQVVTTVAIILLFIATGGHSSRISHGFRGGFSAARIDRPLTGALLGGQQIASDRLNQPASDLGDECKSLTTATVANFDLRQPHCHSVTRSLPGPTVSTNRPHTLSG